ncbi:MULTISPECIES: type IV conjugative transfer system lipoprotein TraV [Morganellaceae]|uniref:Type IV conjugative transfer system lipoprotein TraV n=2 Tax=Morganellaceae TaxID=1903414 RepID=A0A9Q8Q4K8_9GAMM|nr:MULTISPECIES: type IV conjugative transfer system lipoprotein TraV [Morganellaceae]UNH29025.1 type IV conjugative transfer system lipoprotein TraV [Moellerella wisconsensis]UNH32415.1 type IV conjugative transfer system lipoprotein TraV [Moellerella wisconsensis]WJW83626.1 type IV conjugative transfer system lipoprotein TraV [Moellerella wisconsensis]
MWKKRLLIICVATAGLAALSGCSLVDGNSEYGCKGMPNAVTCMNIRDIHQLTDGDDYQDRIDEVSEQQLSGKPVDLKRNGTSSSVSAGGVATGGRYVPVPAATANPQPIRTQAQVMRVLVDPYESADGDLNVPGYVYTEIEPRRWEVGASHAATRSAAIRPMSTTPAAVSSPQAPNK